MDGVKRQVKANHNDFKKFHNLVYNKTYSVAKDIRRCARRYASYYITFQQHRSNPSHETPQDYYRLVNTAAMLNHLHCQLEEGFQTLASVIIINFTF